MIHRSSVQIPTIITVAPTTTIVSPFLLFYFNDFLYVSLTTRVVLLLCRKKKLGWAFPTQYFPVCFWCFDEINSSNTKQKESNFHFLGLILCKTDIQMVRLNLMIRKILFHRLKLFRNLSQELIFWEMFKIFRFWLSEKELFGRYSAHNSVPPHQASLRIRRQQGCSQTLDRCRAS